MNGPGQVFGTRQVLLTVIIVVAVLRLAEEVFIPLAMAILLTFLLAPLVGRLQCWGVKRSLAVIVSMGFALTVVCFLADIAFNQLNDLVHELPGYQRQLHENLTHIRGAVRGGVADVTKAVEQLGKELQRVAPTAPPPTEVRKVEIIEPPPTPLQMVRDFIGPVVKPFGTALVVITLVAFMLLRLPDLRERLIRVLGRRNIHSTTEALSDAAQRVSRYLAMQLLINSWTGLVVGLGLWALDVPNPVLWGGLALVLRFVPYVGIWSAMVIPFALSFAVSNDVSRPLLVLGLFGILELFNYTVLEPWLYSNHTGISSVALLLSAAFWTWLWGGIGLILAVPMTVCVAVMSKYIPQLEFLRVLLGDEPVLEPHQRLYQRLLAGNRDEADTLLDETLRSGGSMLHAADVAIVPAVRMLESDYDRRALTPARRKVVLDHVSDWIEERLEALENPKSKVNKQRGSRVAGQPSWVLCVPAADRADEIVAKLLTLVLQERGIDASLVRPEALEQAPLTDDDRAVDAVVVSALPPEAVSPARAVSRGIRMRTQQVPLVVGLWDPDNDLTKPRQRLEAAGAQRLVVSFAECVTALEALIPPAAAAPPLAPSERGAILEA
jgi:predicted PurR-regulated permease PerM